MPDPTRRLVLLTGVPGSGKSTAATKIAGRFGPDWTVVRCDDFIGPTFRIFPGRPWGEIREFHHRLAGQSTGWHMSQGRHVLVEGHVKDSNELGYLEQGVRDIYNGPWSRTVVFLDGDVEEIVARLTADPYRETTWVGTDRPAKFRNWIMTWAIDPRIASVSIDGTGKSADWVAQEIATVANLW